MKKFLTVLLVIAVMFTFSFGSAFAVTKTDAEANINAAAKELQASLDTAYNSAVTRVTATTEVSATFGGKTVTAGAEALKKAAADIYADETAKIELGRQYLLTNIAAHTAACDTVANAKALFDGTAKYAKTEKLGAGWVDVTENAVIDLNDYAYAADTFYANIIMNYATYINGYDLMFVSYALPEIVAEVETAITAVQLAQYGDKVVCEDDPYETTYAEAAAAIVAEMLAEVADMNDTTLTRDEIVTNWVALDGYVSTELTPTSWYDKSAKKVETVGTPAAEDTIYTYVLNTASGAKAYDWACGVTGCTTPHPIKADASLAADDAQNAVDVAAALANASKNNADVYQAIYNVVKGQAWSAAEKAEYLAGIQKIIDAANEVNAYRAAEGSTDMILVSTSDAAPGNLAVAIVDAVKAAKAEAARLQAEVDKTGELRWDADGIAEELEEMVDAIYFATNTTELDAAKDLGLTDYDREKVEFVKACYVDDLKDALKAQLYTELGYAKYYDAEAEKITAIYDEVIAKVEAAATEAQARKAANTYIAAKINAVDAKAAVKSAIQDLKNFDAEEDAVEAYAEYLYGRISPIKDNYVNVNYQLTSDKLADFYAKNGARTAEEIAALHDAALEWVAGFETKAEIDAAADAVEAQIAALPKASALTLADKDAVAAAEAAYRALNGAEQAQVYNYGTLETLKAAVEIKETAEIAKAIKALPAKVTVADKAAIEAAQAMVDAYEEDALYIKYNATPADFATYTDTTGKLAKAWTDLRTADDLAVEAEIAALGVDPSVAAVKAARDAYEAYVEYWTSYEDGGYYAADDINNLSTLVYAEKKIGAKVIYDVRALKITAGSTAKKGSITVKWTVEGNEDAADYYVIAKSTKKNSGFKKVFETEKMSYKNTKGLKKGTRYYYKVKAVAVVDGVEYTSDWSNKAYRVAK